MHVAHGVKSAQKKQKAYYEGSGCPPGAPWSAGDIWQCLQTRLMFITDTQGGGCYWHLVGVVTAAARHPRAQDALPPPPPQNDLAPTSTAPSFRDPRSKNIYFWGSRAQVEEMCTHTRTLLFNQQTEGQRSALLLILYKQLHLRSPGAFPTG